MDNKKLISFVIPCFNEEGNVENISNAIIKLFDDKLSNYNYELVFIDNDSKDKTRDIIRELCKKNKNIKAIFNVKNFGQFNSPYYGILNATGDAIVSIACDFQEPVDMIPKFVSAWEEGYKIAIEQIKMFTGFGLYDKEFIDILRKLDDPTPFFRGLVAELGYKIKQIPFEQGKRTKGKSSNNFYSLFDAAMLSFTSYTKIGLRMATFIGGIASLVSLIIAIVYLILKLLYWERYPAGMIPVLLGMLFLGSIQILFIGIIGEYVLAINQRTMKRPLVVEEERINF